MFELLINKLLNLLLDSIWVGGMFWLFLLGIMKVVNPKFAKARYYISIILFFSLLLLLFIVSLGYDSLYEIWLRPKIFVFIQSYEVKRSSDFNFLDRIQLFTINNGNYIIILWCLGVLIYSYQLLFQIKKLYNIQESKKSQTDLQLLVKELTTKLRIRKEVIIRCMSNGSHPFTIGYLKPIIYFPVQVMTGFSEEAIELILFHELIHIKRGDYFMNFIQVCIEAVFFFNPFIRYISTVVRRERESSCDHVVVAHGYSKTAYAKALQQSYEMHYNLALSFGNKNVFSRIKNLKKYNTSNQNTRLGVKFINLFIAIVFMVSVFGFGIYAKRNISGVELIVTEKTILYPQQEIRNDTTVYKIDAHRILYKYKDRLIAYTIDGVHMKEELLNFEQLEKDEGASTVYSIENKISGEIIDMYVKSKEKSDLKTLIDELREKCLIKYQGSVFYVTPLGVLYVDNKKVPEDIQKKYAKVIKENNNFSKETIKFTKELILQLQKDQLVPADFDEVTAIFQPKEKDLVLLNSVPLSKTFADKYLIYLKRIYGDRLYSNSSYIIK